MQYGVFIQAGVLTRQVFQSPCHRVLRYEGFGVQCANCQLLFSVAVRAKSEQ